MSLPRCHNCLYSDMYLRFIIYLLSDVQCLSTNILQEMTSNAWEVLCRNVDEISHSISFPSVVQLRSMKSTAMTEFYWFLNNLACLCIFTWAFIIRCAVLVNKYPSGNDFQCMGSFVQKCGRDFTQYFISVSSSASIHEINCNDWVLLVPE